MRRVGTWIAGGLLLGGTIALSIVSGDEGRISVRGVVHPPPAAGPVSFRVLLIPVAPDEEGIYRVAGTPAGLQVDCDPTGSSGGEFVLDLVVGKEYELRVDLLGADGFPRPDGTYYFAGLVGPEQERSTWVGIAGEVPIPLRFEWRARARSLGNFLLPRRSTRGGFDVAQYVAFASAPL